MPLSAVYLGTRVESWNMSTQAWTDLKREYRTGSLTMSCGQAGIPKTSRLGTQFFAHRPGADCELHEGGPESPEHLATKTTVAQAAREDGWDAVVEYPSRDRTWIADVLLSKGSRVLVIEAQWSPQTQVDFERRQARYAAFGVECLWLVAEVNAQNAMTVPHYVLGGTVDELTVRLPSVLSEDVYPLGDGVKHILRGEIRPVVELRATTAAIITQMAKCWNCDKWMSHWSVTKLQLLSRCGDTLTLEWPDHWSRWAPARHEQHLEGPVRTAMGASTLPAPVSLGRRHRSDLPEVHYLAMVCPWCNYVQGDGMLEWLHSAADYTVPLGQLALPFSDAVRARPHV